MRQKFVSMNMHRSSLKTLWQPNVGNDGSFSSCLLLSSAPNRAKQKRIISHFQHLYFNKCWLCENVMICSIRNFVFTAWNTCRSGSIHATTDVAKFLSHKKFIYMVPWRGLTRFALLSAWRTKPLQVNMMQHCLTFSNHFTAGYISAT